MKETELLKALESLQQDYSQLQRELTFIAETEGSSFDCLTFCHGWFSSPPTPPGG
jgi:hypothetical protein